MRHVRGPDSSPRATESDERKAPPRPAPPLLRPERRGDAEGRPAADCCAEAVEKENFQTVRVLLVRGQLCWSSARTLGVTHTSRRATRGRALDGSEPAKQCLSPWLRLVWRGVASFSATAQLRPARR